MGRTNAMLDVGNGNNSVASATYGVAGEIASMSYFGMSETRQYNNLFQLTRQTATSGQSTVMDMQYKFTAAANNGRIYQSIDGVTGETVDYTYDPLSRLTKAETEGSTGVQWGRATPTTGSGT